MELAAEMPVSCQAIAKHLGLLDSVGLVDRTEQGRRVVYAARVRPLRDVATWLQTVGEEWDDRLERLKKSLD
jgi:DNA-binding transcriptional ArsR family regulator